MFSNFELSPLFIILLWVLFYALIDEPCPSDDTTEDFTIYDYPKYCKDCGYMNSFECGNCTNCGYCITSDGRGSCVPGDAGGPYFASDCAEYQYGPNYNGIYPYLRYLSYPFHRNYRSDYPRRNWSHTRPWYRRSDGQSAGLHKRPWYRRHNRPTVGRSVGEVVGRSDGGSVGRSDGRSVGEVVGRPVGRSDGRSDGRSGGEVVGRPDGRSVGRFNRISGGGFVGRRDARR